MKSLIRKQNLLPLALGAGLILVSGQAGAEDNLYYNQPTQYNTHQQYSPQSQQSSVDQQYKMPSSYNGQYYPNDDTSAIGYHGTTTTSQNQPSTSGSYYYYYY